MTAVDQLKYPPQPIVLRNSVSVVIRPLAETDGIALAEFYAGIPPADEIFYCPHPLTRECALRNAANALSPHEVVVVAELPGGGIGGYAWYRWEAGAALSGFGICIARPLQGSGAGKHLMLRLKEIAVTVGPPLMTLTVQKRNPKAVELYQRMGFRIIREQLRQADGEPEYYMELPVR